MITRLKIRMTGDTTDFREVWQSMFEQSKDPVSGDTVQTLDMFGCDLTVYEDRVEGEIALFGVGHPMQDMSPTFDYSWTCLCRDTHYLCMLLPEAEVIGYSVAMTVPICCSSLVLMSRMLEHESWNREMTTESSIHMLAYKSKVEQFLIFDTNRYLKKRLENPERVDLSEQMISLRHTVRWNAQKMFRNKAGRKIRKGHKLLVWHLYQPETQAVIVRQFFHQYSKIDKLAFEEVGEKPDCIKELNREVIATVNRLLEE